MDETYGSSFNAENSILINLAKTYEIRDIRNIQKLSEAWDEITSIFNQKTLQNLSKKQLQKRLTNLAYSQRKKFNTLSSGSRSKPMDLEEFALTNEENAFHEKQVFFENSLLLDLAKKHQVRTIRNLQKLDLAWTEICCNFNEVTNRDFGKKELQSRLFSLTRRRKSEEDNYVRQKMRSEAARERTEMKRLEVEMIRLKKEELLLQAAQMKLKEAEHLEKCAFLELKKLQKNCDL